MEALPHGPRDHGYILHNQGLLHPDFLYNPEQGFKCNFKRGIKFNEKTKKYQFILDIDGYVDKIGIDRLLVKSSEELREIMCSLINKNIYSIFENSITPEFKAEINHE